MADHLRALRAKLVETMAGELAADWEIDCWLPLLAWVGTVIRAVEVVMKEGSKL